MRRLLAVVAFALASEGAGAQNRTPPAPTPPPGAFSEPSSTPAPGGPPARAVAPQGSPQAAPGAAGPAEPPAPLPLESWRFNARERTGRGLAAWKNEKPAEAVEAMDTAARLRPADPLAAYNSGTAHLGAGLGDAAQILERSIAAAPPELQPDGFYNLGNARLEAKNAAGAVDAYKETLRRSPGHPGARRNLELALKMLEEQQKKQQQQQQNQNQDSKDQKQQSEGGSGSQNQQQKDQQQQQNDEPQQQQGDPQQGDGQPQPQQGAGSQKDQPLPQFKDQQDMSREQAASILQAVENLERERRREEAKARARAKTSVEKDW